MYPIKKLLSKINTQNFIVSLCILAICIGTQQIQTAAWYTGLIEFSRDSLGVLMAVIIATNYKWSDFVKYKIPYIIWSVLGILLCAVLLPMVIQKRAEFYTADTIIIALGIFLMGYCVIHTLISFLAEKYRPKLYLPLFGIWVAMLLLMIFSRSRQLWPACYFVLFLCYYLTPQTPSQRTNTVSGLINGIILGYIAIQMHALLCRPYDRLRYYGNFCNPNHNCMFLCMCLGAILAKILMLVKGNYGKAVKIFYFLLAGSCYSLICMTICRSGYLAAVVMTVFFLIAYCKLRKERIFIRTGALLLLIFVTCLPLTYLAVRYIPTIHPHVLFYFQEGYSEERVHSWDERNSEKYITFQQLMRGILGRFWVIKDAQEDSGCTESAVDMNIAESDHLETASNAVNIPSATLPETELDPDKIPVLEDEEASAFLVRYSIYKWYFTHLSLRGMPYEEQGFQLTATHWIQDTHNIYLDYGINFGYPVMILFTVFIWWGIGRLFKQGISRQDAVKLSCLMIACLPPVFGLFEFA